MMPSILEQRPRPELFELPFDSFIIIGVVNLSEAGILVFEVDDMREQKIIEEKRDNKVGDEWEIAERPEPELTPSGGNTLAQVDRASEKNVEKTELNPSPGYKIIKRSGT